MTLKTLVTGVAAAALVGAAAAGVTSIASGAPVAERPAVAPMVFGVPMPLDANVATKDELTSVLVGLADPNGGPFQTRSGLVQGGVGFFEGRTADRMLAKANQQGILPLAFDVNNIRSSGGAATASVTASGPQLAARTQDVSFVYDNGWKLSKASATALLTSLGN